MCKLKLPEELAGFFEVGDYGLVGVLHEHAVPRRSAAKTASCVDELDERQIPFPAYARIVFAERRRYMNHSRSGIKRYITVRNNAPSLFALVIYGEREERLVLCADKRAALEAFLYNCRFAKNFLYARLCHYQQTAFKFNLTVILVGIYAKRNVARERPWRSCPSKKLGAVARAFYGERYEY